MDDIIKLLGLEDENIEVVSIEIKGSEKIIRLKSKAYSHFCPLFQAKMYSKGLYERTIRHPVTQDG